MTFSEKNNAWFTCLRTNPQARIRLFCFPYSGSGASIFFNWADGLPTTVEVWTAQLPGRGSRLSEPAFTELTSLVHTMAPRLLPFLDRPFGLFGHSMGALVGFELARHLRQTGGPKPIHLFLSGRSAPQLPPEEAPIYNLPETAFVEKLRQMNGMAPEILASTELMQLLLPILRADFSVCETYLYRPEPPVDCSISAYGGVQDHDVSTDRLERWREQTIAAFSLHMFPGNHFFINTARQLVLKTMAREIDHLMNVHNLRG